MIQRDLPLDIPKARDDALELIAIGRVTLNYDYEELGYRILLNQIVEFKYRVSNYHKALDECSLIAFTAELNINQN